MAYLPTQLSPNIENDWIPFPWEPVCRANHRSAPRNFTKEGQNLLNEVKSLRGSDLEIVIHLFFFVEDFKKGILTTLQKTSPKYQHLGWQITSFIKKNNSCKATWLPTHLSIDKFSLGLNPKMPIDPYTTAYLSSGQLIKAPSGNSCRPYYPQQGRCFPAVNRALPESKGAKIKMEAVTGF